MVSDFYLDYVGGAQTSMRQQRAALEAAGHEVFMLRSVRPRRGDRQPRVREVGDGIELRPAYTVPVLQLPVTGARRRLVERLKDYFARTEIDVVHLQTEFGIAHAATTAAHELGIPVVATIHTFYWQSSGLFPTLSLPIISPGLQNVTGVRFPKVRLSRRPSDNLMRNLTLALAQRVDVVVSPSAHQADDLRAAGLQVPVEVVPNPIASAAAPPAILTMEQAAHPRLLWVARCEPEKRPLVFAEAVLAALGRGARFETDFVGDGAQLGALKELTAAEPSIRVHGSMDHPGVVELMDAASLVVLSSYGFDNQPMTIAEAASRYRGVLYCDPNLKEGLTHSGHLTNGPDADAMAHAIVELVADPARLVELSRGAVEDSATFSAAAFVERIERVYAEAAAQRVA